MQATQPHQAKKTITQPFEIIQPLIPFIVALKIPHMDEHINEIIKTQCETARATISAMVLDKTIEHCTKTEDLSLNDSSLFVLHYNQLQAS